MGVENQRFSGSISIEAVESAACRACGAVLCDHTDLEFAGLAPPEKVRTGDQAGPAGNTGSRSRTAGSGSLVPIETLRAYLRYDPETGHIALIRDTLYRRAGDRADHPGARGYLYVSLFSIGFRAHRVAWALHFGRWPEQEIDHINGVRDDNRIANLRDVSPQANRMNTAVNSRNTSGHVGITRRVKKGKEGAWCAYIKRDGRRRWLGSFPTIEEAIQARDAAQAALGFHPNHGCRRVAPREQPGTVGSAGPAASLITPFITEAIHDPQP